MELDIACCTDLLDGPVEPVYDDQHQPAQGGSVGAQMAEGFGEVFVAAEVVAAVAA